VKISNENIMKTKQNMPEAHSRKWINKSYADQHSPLTAKHQNNCEMLVFLSTVEERL
jgi:hypothetical protein